MSADQHRYPATHSERVRWHEQGTPAPFAPYTSAAPDAYRDGLLRGFRVHRGTGPHEERARSLAGDAGSHTRKERYL